MRIWNQSRNENQFVVVTYARLAYCIDILIEHGANSWNVRGIPQLTTGIQIRWCRDVLNTDVVISTKFNLVFPCGNATNFYILENDTISTYHELNLNWFWAIPHGANDNWKFVKKCDIWVLKYWWFSKAFRESNMRWNGPVLD